MDRLELGVSNRGVHECRDVGPLDESDEIHHGRRHSVLMRGYEARVVYRVATNAYLVLAPAPRPLRAAHRQEGRVHGDDRVFVNVISQLKSSVHRRGVGNDQRCVLSHAIVADAGKSDGLRARRKIFDLRGRRRLGAQEYRREVGELPAQFGVEPGDFNRGLSRVSQHVTGHVDGRNVGDFWNDGRIVRLSRRVALASWDEVIDFALIEIAFLIGDRRPVPGRLRR